jgi:hypothetical protein
MLPLVKKFHGEKGRLRWCIVVMRQPVILSPKFRAKYSHIFTKAPQNITLVCRIDCLACQDEFFANNPLDVKENDEHAPDMPLTAHAFFPEHLSSHCQGLCCTFSEICTTVAAVPLSDPSQNSIRPDTRLQIKGLKISAPPPSCVKFCTLTPKIHYYYHPPLCRATMTAVQLATPVPEIIDTL